MNVSSISYRCYSIITEKLPALTYQQKKMSAIVLVALTIIGAVYAVYRSCLGKQTDAYPLLLKKEEIVQKPVKVTPSHKNLLGGKESNTPSLFLLPENKVIHIENDSEESYLTDYDESELIQDDESDSMNNDEADAIDETIEGSKTSTIMSITENLENPNYPIIWIARDKPFNQESANKIELYFKQQEKNVRTKFFESCLKTVFIASETSFFKSFGPKDGFLEQGLIEDYTGQADRSNRNLLNPSSTRWPRLFNDRKPNSSEYIKEVLKELTSILTSKMSYRDLSDLIAENLSDLISKDGTKSSRIFKKHVSRGLKNFLQEQKQWDPSPIKDINTETLKGSIEPKLRLSPQKKSPQILQQLDEESIEAHDSHDSFLNLTKFNAPVMTMEKVLSQNPINYSDIFLIDPFDVEELSKLIAAIQDRIVDLDILLKTITQNTTFDEDAKSESELGKTLDVEPILEFLILTNFINRTDPEPEREKEYVKRLSMEVILNFKILVLDPSGRSAEENVDEKKEFLESLGHVLMSCNENLSWCLCDQLLNLTHNYLITLAIKELRNFLESHHLWNPTPSENSNVSENDNPPFWLPSRPTMEKVLSENAVNYDDILLIDLFDIEELSQLLKAIKDGTVDVPQLLLAVEKKEISEWESGNKSYIEPISTSLLLFGVAATSHSIRNEEIKPYVEKLCRKIILNFRQLFFDSIGLKVNENELEREQFLNNLEFILEYENENLSQVLSDQILKLDNGYYPTREVLVELSQFLASIEQWNPTPFEIDDESIQTSQTEQRASIDDETEDANYPNAFFIDSDAPKSDEHRKKIELRIKTQQKLSHHFIFNRLIDRCIDIRYKEFNFVLENKLTSKRNKDVKAIAKKMLSVLTSRMSDQDISDLISENLLSLEVTSDGKILSKKDLNKNQLRLFLKARVLLATKRMLRYQKKWNLSPTEAFKIESGHQLVGL